MKKRIRPARSIAEDYHIFGDRRCKILSPSPVPATPEQPRSSIPSAPPVPRPPPRSPRRSRRFARLRGAFEFQHRLGDLLDPLRLLLVSRAYFVPRFFTLAALSVMLITAVICFSLAAPSSDFEMEPSIKRRCGTLMLDIRRDHVTARLRWASTSFLLFQSPVILTDETSDFIGPRSFSHCSR
jgi:hypothetical protein